MNATANKSTASKLRARIVALGNDLAWSRDPEFTAAAKRALRKAELELTVLLVADGAK